MAVLVFSALLLLSLDACFARNIDERKKEKNALKIIVLGDFGQAGLQGQTRVAEGMAIWAAEHDPDWILSVGDNFYPSGIDSVTDRQIDRKWRDMYSAPSLANLNWYMSLGNHDYGDWVGEEWNQVELGKVEPRWILPHLWYDFVEQRDDFSIHFIVIDTETFRLSIERNNYTDMITWFSVVLSQSTADWKFVVGHRHIFSVGEHGPVTHPLYNVFVPTMEHYGVDAYICGHDHNLQHIKDVSGTGMDYVLSGGGGAGLYLYSRENEEYIREHYNAEPLYFRAGYGFMTMEVSADEAVFEFFNPAAELQYSYTRYKQGK